MKGNWYRPIVCLTNDKEEVVKKLQEQCQGIKKSDFTWFFRFWLYNIYLMGSSCSKNQILKFALWIAASLWNVCVLVMICSLMPPHLTRSCKELMTSGVREDYFPFSHTVYLWLVLELAWDRFLIRISHSNRTLFPTEFLLHIWI